MRQRATDFHGGLRLLIECAKPGFVISDYGQLRAMGFDVMACGGPEREVRECPLVRGEGCPLAAQADVVLFAGNDGPIRRSVLEAVRARHPGLPILVEVPRSVGAVSDELPDGCFALPRPASIGTRARVLRQALSSRSAAYRSQSTHESSG